MIGRGMMWYDMIVREAVPGFPGHTSLQVSIFIFSVYFNLILSNHTFSVSMIEILYSVYSKIKHSEINKEILVKALNSILLQKTIHNGRHSKSITASVAFL